MREVFIIVGHEQYETDRIIGVRWSEGKARAFLTKTREERPWRMDSYDIEVHNEQRLVRTID